MFSDSDSCGPLPSSRHKGSLRSWFHNDYYRFFFKFWSVFLHIFTFTFYFFTFTFQGSLFLILILINYHFHFHLFTFTFSLSCFTFTFSLLLVHYHTSLSLSPFHFYFFTFTFSLSCFTLTFSLIVFPLSFSHFHLFTKVDTDTMVLIIEQFLLLILIMGRFMMPRVGILSSFSSNMDACWILLI